MSHQHVQTNRPHHTAEHQSLDDGSKPPHQFLDFRGAGWRVGDVTDHQQAAPADWNRTLLQDTTYHSSLPATNKLESRTQRMKSHSTGLHGGSVAQLSYESRRQKSTENSCSFTLQLTTTIHRFYCEAAAGCDVMQPQ